MIDVGGFTFFLQNKNMVLSRNFKGFSDIGMRSISVKENACLAIQVSKNNIHLPNGFTEYWHNSELCFSRHESIRGHNNPRTWRSFKILRNILELFSIKLYSLRKKENTPYSLDENPTLRLVIEL